jgi:hypothetical protein
MASSESLNLGEFARFPQEVRDVIWADFAPSPRYQEGDDSEDSDDEDNEPGSLGILRTCHRLHEEILPHIYEK